MKKYRMILLLLLSAVLLAGCGKKADPGERPAATPTPVIVETPEPTPTPSSAPTPAAASTQTPAGAPTPAAAASPAPMPAVTTTPTSTPTSAPAASPPPPPSPSPSPTPTPVQGAPTVTKNPTDETVVVGGSCSFTADYQNAVYATWHFVSPDGQKDFDYGGIGVEFPTMTVLNGMYSNLQLSNVPQGMNGWKVYCRYSNDVGSVDTQKATVTVTAAGQGGAAARPGASASTAAAYGGFTGLFVDEDNEMTMEISGDSSWYDVKVTWPISSSEIYTWEFGGTFNNEGVLYYDNCLRTQYTYDEQDNEDSQIWTDGSGDLDFSTSKDGMYWSFYDDPNFSIDDIFFGRA